MRFHHLLPVRDVLEAAPHDLAAHGEAHEVEPGPQLQVVGELGDVDGDALLRPCRDARRFRSTPADQRTAGRCQALVAAPGNRAQLTLFIALVGLRMTD